MLFYYPKFIVL